MRQVLAFAISASRFFRSTAEDQNPEPLLRHTPTTDPSPLRLRGASPYAHEEAVGQSRLQALLADPTAVTDRLGTRHRLLVV